jgi:hypothetical protein
LPFDGKGGAESEGGEWEPFCLESGSTKETGHLKEHGSEKYPTG